ncbi:MAG: prephenate dehydratase [Thermoleophilaceae bacterium]|nr:prephenate dehydratase [Thermoleophilaceae bacterium]
MRVAYLGPEGTYAEEALRRSAPGEVEELPYPTVHEAVMAVQGGEVDRAVVPIENSIEGSVNATLDALATEASEVRIAGEVVLEIRHCLVSPPGVRVDQVERVLSHPQAMAQCARFLRERLATVERAPASSTADAVRTVASAGKPWAAIASRMAAELYGCEVLADGIADHADNVTRFVWLAPAGAPPMGEPSKTSIVFWGFNDESPGALVAVLSELSERGINLTRIESRPRRVRLGHYMFFADLEGTCDEPRVQAALDGLRRRVETLRVLGSYPAAPVIDSGRAGP